MHFEPWKNASAFRQTRLWRVLFVTLYLLHLLFRQLSWVCASQGFLQEWDGIPYLFQCSLLEDLGSVNITKDHTVTQKVNNVFISDIYFLLKPILFASSWFIKQEFVNTLVPKLSIHQCYHYIIIIKKKEKDFVYVVKIPSHSIFYGIFSLACATKWSMLSVTRHCTTHLWEIILEWRCSKTVLRKQTAQFWQRMCSSLLCKPHWGAEEKLSTTGEYCF